MKVLFHLNELNYRGTTVAGADYAKYNQEILGNESVISYLADSTFSGDGANEPEVIEKFKLLYPVRPVYNNQYDTVCHDVDVAYFIRSGHQEPLPTNTKTAVHAVFKYNEPHGDRYAYISQWLSEDQSGGAIPWVPHIVSLPEANDDLRTRMGIPADKIIIGRHGGASTFDAPYGYEAVNFILEHDPRYVFVFLNTPRFVDHPNVLFCNPIHDLQLKANYLAMCDGFIHSRSIGESFGLAICESLYFNKPVFSFTGGHDRHHVMLLEHTGLMYRNTAELIDRLLNVKSYNGNYRSIVDQFNPATVMAKFDQVFLK